MKFMKKMKFIKKGEIHENNVNFMKKKGELHEKNVSIMKN